jgi:hypothetical protein
MYVLDLAARTGKTDSSNLTYITAEYVFIKLAPKKLYGISLSQALASFQQVICFL